MPAAAAKSQQSILPVFANDVSKRPMNTAPPPSSEMRDRHVTAAAAAKDCPPAVENQSEDEIPFAGDCPEAWVIIVTHNHREQISRCLESLRTTWSGSLAVIVVDNASTDGTADWVERECPSCTVLRSEKNLGFGRAVNWAIRSAVPASAEAVILLNPDTVVTPGWDQELLRTAARDERIAIVQSKLLLLAPEDPPRLNSAGNGVHVTGIGFCSHYNEPDGADFQFDVDIAGACGAAMLIRTDLFARIGMFDERMFLYHEDTDLCTRARLAGRRVVLCARSIVRHDYEFEKGRSKYYHFEKNRWLWLLKTYRLPTLLRLAPSLAVVEVAVLLHALQRRWFLLKLRSYGELLVLMPSCLRERYRVQATRTEPDGVLLAHCSTEIHLPGMEQARSLALLNRILRWCGRLTGFRSFHNRQASWRNEATLALAASGVRDCEPSLSTDYGRAAHSRNTQGRITLVDQGDGIATASGNREWFGSVRGVHCLAAGREQESP